MSDKTKLEIVSEYLYTGISQTRLMAKYNFRGNGNLYHCMIKFWILDEYMSHKKDYQWKN